MGLNTYVEGFKPPDEKWKKMKAVWDACEAAGTTLPDEVGRFFGDERPDDKGVKVGEGDLKRTGALRDWTDKDMCSGFEIDITKLPEDVTLIRFVNSF